MRASSLERFEAGTVDGFIFGEEDVGSDSEGGEK